MDEDMDLEEKVNKMEETMKLMEAGNGKRTYTVEDIQNILEIGRSSAYNLVKTGKFHCVNIGGHIRISKKSFDNWLDTI